MDFSCDLSTVLQKKKKWEDPWDMSQHFAQTKFGWILSMIYEMQEKLYPKVQILPNKYNTNNSIPSFVWFSNYPFKMQRHYTSIT